MSLCATAAPTVVFAEDGDTATPANVGGMTYSDMVAQLAEIAECYSLPYFMISEGDTTYINGEKVATTTVEVDRDFAFSDKYKKYWLDSTAFGSYEELVSAANRLNAYIDSTRADVNTAEKNLTDTLCHVCR